MTQELLGIIVAVGGWTVVLIAAVKWIADRAANRFSERWVRQRELEVEQFRALSAQSQSVLSAALNSFASGHSAAHERRLAAIDRVWKAIIATRTNAPTAVMLADILTDEEFATLHERPDILQDLLPHDLKRETTKLLAHTADVEEHRPFCGELPWALFYVYRAIHGRLLVVLQQGIDRGVFTPWREDAGMQQLLASVLTRDELTSVKAGAVGGWFSTLQVLEGKFLREVQAIISGSRAIDTGLQEANRILAAVQAVQRSGQ